MLGPLASVTRPYMTFLYVASQVLAPASFPRFVASPQLPSPRTSVNRSYPLGMSVLLETPSFVQGTCTP